MGLDGSYNGPFRLVLGAIFVQVYPIFIHLLGVSRVTGLTANLADPSTHLMLSVCFGLNGLVEVGNYFPDSDEFVLQFVDDEDPAKDHMGTVPADSDYHRACLDTVTYFVKDLAAGKRSTETKDVPK